MATERQAAARARSSLKRAQGHVRAAVRELSAVAYRVTVADLELEPGDSLEPVLELIATELEAGPLELTITRPGDQAGDHHHGALEGAKGDSTA